VNILFVSLIEEGGDWDRRNRLKVYEGIYLMSIRNFKQAADLFLDSLSTFTCTELMSFQKFIKYTVLMSAIALDRPTVKERVIHAPEILEVLHHLPEVGELIRSLYSCDYRRFFMALGTSTKLTSILFPSIHRRTPSHIT
jgi:26S proteasome regulatory subunit N7